MRILFIGRVTAACKSIMDLISIRSTDGILMFLMILEGRIMAQPFDISLCKADRAFVVLLVASPRPFNNVSNLSLAPSLQVSHLKRPIAQCDNNIIFVDVEHKKISLR